MPPPEGCPAEFALLYPNDQELHWPQEGPRAVREPEHAIRLFPFECVLDVDRCLRLDNKGDQTEEQEECGVDVFSSGLVFRDSEGGRS